MIRSLLDPLEHRSGCLAGVRPSTAALAALLTAIALVLTGCGAPGCPSSSQDTPVRVSQQAAQRLQARVEQIAGSASPDFVLEMTDEEATSYLALNLGQSPVSEAEVRFLAGSVALNARVAQLLNLQVATIWSAQVVDQQVRVKIESASVACVPVPPQLLDSLSATLNQMIVESQVNIRVKDIRFEPGRATVSGAKVR
jgi:hypothetical protein